MIDINYRNTIGGLSDPNLILDGEIPHQVRQDAWSKIGSEDTQRENPSPQRSSPRGEQSGRSTRPRNLVEDVGRIRGEAGEYIHATEFLLPREGVVGRRATSICLGRLPHQERPRIPRASITSSSYRAHRAAPLSLFLPPPPSLSLSFSMYILHAHTRLHVHPRTTTRTSHPSLVPDGTGVANFSEWNSGTTATKF